ncbi:MAG TPA: acyl-CoA dehydrogenase family protein, partial [Acidimicrobiales bacterium]|nr:acyl-CoA dehydrogenase family protein [Acidimicrobiales bacterium]
MDFTFSAEQEALRDTVRSFLTRAGADAYYRAMIDDERGFTDEWWSEITGLGWPGLLIPEAAGGAGLGLVDAVVLQEEMGRVALPGPFLSSSLAATIAALRLGADDLLEGMAGGAIRGTVAIEEAGHGDPLGTVTATATPGGEAGGDGWMLDGVKEVVLDGHTADFAVVAARTPDGLAAFVLD